MDSSENILTNCDVLQLIFRYLDFEDHLKLIEICPQFEYAIVHGVWRLMCRNLYILDTSPDTCLLWYNAVNNVKIEWTLTTEAIHMTLHYSSMYIHKLELNYIHCLENIVSLKYHNLTELLLCSTVVKDTHLQQLAENCLNLQSFSLINFRNSKDESNIRANIFVEIKALNKLEINDISFDTWNYFDIQQLFSLAHLKTLIINIKIGVSNDNKGKNNTSTDRVYNIENLTIGTLPCLQSGSICLIQDLIRFENLKKLSLRLKAVSIDDNVLTQINTACPKLCELSLTGCHFSFKEFPHMNNLMDLTFKLCRNIKLKTFDEIFRKLKLKSLSLKDVRMRDEAEAISDYNYISNTLETFTIERIYRRKILKIFFNQQHTFENVSKVVLKSFLRGFKYTQLCFSHNFPYLKELIMDSFYISIEDILHLKHLKVLKFDIFYGMYWSYLKILFQHPILTHITIMPVDRDDFDSESLPECCEGLTTTLEYLGLPAIVYERGLSFWPSFRQRNKLLKLEIVVYAEVEE